jgi:hypothetical protein
LTRAEYAGVAIIEVPVSIKAIAATKRIGVFWLATFDGPLLRGTLKRMLNSL